MTEANNQRTTTQHGQQDGNDRLQPHSPAQQQSGENFNGIGENGTNDLGDFGNIADGVGASADTSGSAAGATNSGVERQQSGQLDDDGRERSDDDDGYEDDLGDGAGAVAGAGPAI